LLALNAGRCILDFLLREHCLDVLPSALYSAHVFSACKSVTATDYGPTTSWRLSCKCFAFVPAHRGYDDLLNAAALVVQAAPIGSLRTAVGHRTELRSDANGLVGIADNLR
jgi:hypothetical protein